MVAETTKFIILICFPLKSIEDLQRQVRDEIEAREMVQNDFKVKTKILLSLFMNFLNYSHILRLNYIH